MILLEIAEQIDESTKEQRIAKGAEAQRRVRDELKLRFGRDIKKIHVARVGSKWFDISARIKNVLQKVEVKALTASKPYFAFFDTYVHKGSHSPTLDELTARVTSGKYKMFTDAVENEPRGGFPCDNKPDVPKFGRVPAILKKITDSHVLTFVRARLLDDLENKGITYLAIYNRTTQSTSYYHISGENQLDAPKLPHFRKIYFDTYGAPSECAMRVVVRISL